MAEVKPRFDSNVYAITYIVNPNHFYMCDMMRFNLGLIENAESKVANYLKQNYKKNYSEPKKNDLIAFFITNKKKYIRCQVLDIKILNNMITYILFAIDYGFPFYTHKREDMYSLSYAIRQLPSPIIRASLDLLPAAVKFNYKKLKEGKTFHHEWTLDGMERFLECISRNAVVVDFEQTYKSIRFNETIFGTLHVVTASGKMVDVNEKLVDNDVALRAESENDFLKHFLKTNTLKTETWNDCFRSGGVLKKKSGGVSALPNFPKIFERILYPPPREQNPHLKQINDKVLNWLTCSEGIEIDIPKELVEFEERADSEYLYELYNVESVRLKNKTNKDDDEEKVEEEEVPLTREEIERELANLKLQDSHISREKKIDEPQFLPVGFQLQVAIQGTPAVFDAIDIPFDDEEFVSASNNGRSVEDDEGVEDNNDNDYEKWS